MAEDIVSDSLRVGKRTYLPKNPFAVMLRATLSGMSRQVATWLSAERRYERKRLHARAKAADLLSLKDEDGSLTPISRDALTAWTDTWRPEFREGPGEWHWPFLMMAWVKEPRRLDCALWSRKELCGLMIGEATDSRNAVHVRYIEGWPRPLHPFKGRVAGAMVTVAEAYAREVGATVVRLLHPDLAVVPHYARLGYQFEAGGRLDGNLPPRCQKLICVTGIGTGV